MTQALHIIGAGPGIGQAVARKFGRAGWAIALTGRDPARLDRLVSELAAENITAYAVPADATDPVTFRAALQEANRLTGGLSVVHFNAAVVRAQDLFSMTDDEIESDLAINVAAGLHTIRAAVDLFDGGGGTIVVTGGGLAVAPHDSYASLGLGKAALRNTVQGLTGPLAKRGIDLRLATIATLVGPNSVESEGAADTIWHLATDRAAPWEVTYPNRDAVLPTTPLTLIARLTARPEAADALGEGLRALIAPTAEEPGSLGYTLHRDNDDPNVWILYETWASRTDLDAHFAQPYTKAMLDRFPDLLSREMELTFATAIKPRG